MKNGARVKKDNKSPRVGVESMSPDQQKKFRSELAQIGALALLNDTYRPLENLLYGSATCVYEFFHANGYIVLRSQWDSKNIHSALHSYVGWIYAFYGDGDTPIYVGETDRTFVERFKEHAKNKSWWSIWTRVKVFPCPDVTTRKVFESLIGLAGDYGANKLQPPPGDNILDDVVLALLALGNEDNSMPEFPNKMLVDQVNLIQINIDSP